MQQEQLKSHVREVHARLVAHALELSKEGELGLRDGFILRFELVTLLVAGALYRLRQQGREDTLQALWDVTFEGFDHSLRQRGVSDLRIASRMRKLLRGATGRRDVYLTAMEQGDAEGLRQAIARNVLDNALERDPRVDRLLVELERVVSEGEKELSL